MRGAFLSFAAVLIVLPALSAVADSPGVAVEGGAAACVNTGNGEKSAGSAVSAGPILVGDDAGTLTISVLGERTGKPDALGCTFDVVITGASGIGLVAPRASVSDATSAPCTAVRHASCVATASAAWSVSQLGVHVHADAAVAPSPSVSTDHEQAINPSHLPSGALGIEVHYEIGVTGSDGVRTVVDTGTVQILASSVSANVQGVSLP